jgi:hypothetical protein
MLMGSLVYCGQLEFSPYANLVSGMADIDLKAQFARDYCRLLGLPQDSALYTCVTAGTLAIPTLLKAATLMKDKPDWNTGEQLPVEIELQIDPTNPNAAAHNVYHSIFSCPVSKEQSTPTNPPVRLPCGHAICKQSMERLLRQNTRRYNTQTPTRRNCESNGNEKVTSSGCIQIQVSVLSKRGNSRRSDTNIFLIYRYTEV